MVEEAVSHFYSHVLKDGYAIAQAKGDMTREDVEQLRKGLRQQARLDKLKMRTIFSSYEQTVLAVRVDWEPDAEAHDFILGLTGVHVCRADAQQKLLYVSTPYCPYCGYEM